MMTDVQQPAARAEVLNMASPAKPEESTKVAAYKLETRPASSDRTNVIAEFGQTWQSCITCRALPEETLRLETETASSGAGVLYLVLLPSESPSAAWQEWLRAGSPSPGGQLTEVTSKGMRLLLGRGRALFSGRTDNPDDLLAALAQFLFLQTQLEKLEESIESRWAVASKDVDLSHQVNDNDVKRWGHVNEMTEWCALTRMEFVKLDRCMHLPSGGLSESAAKFLARLVDENALSDRLEYVDDELEILEDIYESANDRISEFSYFSREYKVEVWITVILVLELVLLVADIAVGLSR